MLALAIDWLDYSYHIKGSAPLQGKKKKKRKKTEKKKKKQQLSGTWTSINIASETLNINESLKWGTKVNFFNTSN